MNWKKVNLVQNFISKTFSNVKFECVNACLSASLSICAFGSLSLYSSVHTYVNPSLVCWNVSLSVHLSIFVFICPLIHVTIRQIHLRKTTCLFECLSVWSSVLCLPACFSVYLSAHHSNHHQFIYLSIHLSVCLSFCLFIRLYMISNLNLHIIFYIKIISYNGTPHIRHQCGETAVLGCHRFLNNSGVEKMNSI